MWGERVDSGVRGGRKWEWMGGGGEKGVWMNNVVVLEG